MTHGLALTSALGFKYRTDKQVFGKLRLDNLGVRWARRLCGTPLDDRMPFKKMVAGGLVLNHKGQWLCNP